MGGASWGIAEMLSRLRSAVPFAPLTLVWLLLCSSLAAMLSPALASPEQVNTAPPFSLAWLLQGGHRGAALGRGAAGGAPAWRRGCGRHRGDNGAAEPGGGLPAAHALHAVGGRRRRGIDSWRAAWWRPEWRRQWCAGAAAWAAASGSGHAKGQRSRAAGGRLAAAAGDCGGQPHAWGRAAGGAAWGGAAGARAGKRRTRGRSFLVLRLASMLTKHRKKATS